MVGGMRLAMQYLSQWNKINVNCKGDNQGEMKAEQIVMAEYCLK
jgi:hypothetical protein